MKFLVLFILSCIQLLFFHCSMGGSSESTGICGTVSYKENLVSDVKVNLIDSSRKTIDSVFTDINGHFSFQTVTEGNYYNLQGFKDSLSFVRFNLQSDTNLSIQLERTGKIHCNVSLVDDTLKDDIYVYLSGTSFFGKVNKSGDLTIYYVPPGEYELVIEKTGYRKHNENVTVIANQTVSIGPVIMQVDSSADPLPPKWLFIGYDTLSGIVTVSWDSVAGHKCQYKLHIYDPSKYVDLDDGPTYTRNTPQFVDTLFLSLTDKTKDSITLSFRVKATDIISGKQSNITSFVTSTFLHPTTPPPPECSLSNVDSFMIVAVKESLLPAEWIDSTFMYCSFNDTSHFLLRSTKVAEKTNAILFDTLRNLPKTEDSLVTVYYYCKSKSVYGIFSSPSKIMKTVLENPYIKYSIPRPSAPMYGNCTRSSESVGTIAFRFSTVSSPVINDKAEYRIRVYNLTNDSTFYTAWYPVPSIDIDLHNEGNLIIQSQARSRLLPELQSDFSDTLHLSVYKPHQINKPSVPDGNTDVTSSNSCSYISRNIPECSLEHHIAIRYAVSYQASTFADTTNWIYPPDKFTTIVWSITGTAYIRAQTRCTTDTLIVSPWSDALVVSVR